MPVPTIQTGQFPAGAVVGDINTPLLAVDFGELTITAVDVLFGYVQEITDLEVRSINVYSGVSVGSVKMVTGMARDVRCKIKVGHVRFDV